MTPFDLVLVARPDMTAHRPLTNHLLRWCALQGTWGTVQDPASPSKVESWSQSSWFKLVVVLIVAAVVTSVVALAWITVPSLHRKKPCDVAVAEKLQEEIHATTQHGKNYLARFYHQDLCFSNTTVITVPAGVTVNITADPPIKLRHFRFVLSPTAQLYLANVALTGANWTGSEGGAAAAVHGTPNPTHVTAEPQLKSDAGATASKSSSTLAGSEVLQPNTTFTCVNCTFDRNVVWTRHSVAKGGAVYIDGKTAHFKCINCTFADNTARAIGSAAMDDYRSGEDMMGEPVGRASTNATVHGGAIYVGQGNITLISPRFKDNRAVCMASALKTGCTAAANDVSLRARRRRGPCCMLAAVSQIVAFPRDSIAACCNLLRAYQVYLESGAVELGCKELGHGPHPACGLHAQCEDYTRCSHHADKSVSAPCGVLCDTHAPHNHSHPPPSPRTSS